MSEIGISKPKMLRKTKLEILKKQYKKKIQPKSDPFMEVIGSSSEYDIDLIALFSLEVTFPHSRMLF